MDLSGFFSLRFGLQNLFRDQNFSVFNEKSQMLMP